MARRTSYRALAVALGGSLVAHGAIGGVALWIGDDAASERDSEPIPIEVVAPEVPLPPEVPKDLPTERTVLAEDVTLPRPKPLASKQGTRAEKPTPAHKADSPAHKADSPAHKLPPDAHAPDSDAHRAPPDAHKPDSTAHEPTAPPQAPGESAPDTDGETRAWVAAATGAVLGAAGDETPEPDVLAQAQDHPVIDPSLVDLRGFVPDDSRLILILRTDRIRGTEWAKPLKQILSPMPDYRTVIAGTGLAVADAFDLIVIATPKPSDPAMTFLAAHTSEDEAELRDRLAIRKGSDDRLVEWTQLGNGVTLGERMDERVEANDDPRSYLIPRPGWIVLSRPEHLPHVFPPAKSTKRPTPPEWLARLDQIAAQTGEGPAAPILLLSATDLRVDQIELPGLPDLPRPERITVTISAHKDGLIFVGSVTLGDETKAKEFHAAAIRARDEALHSLAAKFFLGRLHAHAAVQRLKLSQSGAFVTFSTSIATREAHGLLRNVASWSRAWFTRAEKKEPANEP